jgi:hypothetical protein
MVEKNHSNRNTEETDSCQGNSEIGNFGGVLIAGAWAFVGLLLVAIFWPNMTERIKFFIGTLWVLITTFAVIAQVLISRRQWEAMRTQIGKMEEQLQFSQSSFRASSRAYVFVSAATLKFPISTGHYPQPSVEFRNSGQTPAYNVIRLERTFLMGEVQERATKGLMPPTRPLDKIGHGIIGASDVMSLHPDPQDWKDDDQRSAAIQGLATYHLWGFIRYTDVFGVEHSCKFSLYARNSTVTKLSFGYGGNVEEANSNRGR